MAYEIDSSYFDTIGENQAYILGLLFTDGCHSKRGNIYLCLQIGDKPILDKIKDQLKYEGPLSNLKARTQRHQAQVALVFTNKKLSARLLELGLVPAKSLISEYPNWLTAETERHFIRGCIDGDGHISTKSKTKFTISFVGTHSMCTGLANAFKFYCGAEVRIRRKPKNSTKNTYELYLGLKAGSVKVLDWLYTNAQLYIDRKYEAAMQQIKLSVMRDEAAQPQFCSVDGCEFTVFAKGLCRRHYQRKCYKIKNGLAEKLPSICSIDSCKRTIYAKGLCSPHYLRQRRAIKRAVSDELCAALPHA